MTFSKEYPPEAISGDEVGPYGKIKDPANLFDVGQDLTAEAVFLDARTAEAVIKMGAHQARHDEWWLWLDMLMDTSFAWYHDFETWVRLVAKEGRGPTEEDELRAHFESIRDRRVFFSAGIKGLCAHLHAVPQEHRKRPAIGELEMNENQATGVMKLVLYDPRSSSEEKEEAKPEWYSTDLKLTFKQSDDGWRIDKISLERAD